MIKFTFGRKLREGLGGLLTEEGLEKALESAIETYNWNIEKYGKAPTDFYCSFAGSDKKDFKNTTTFYDAKFIYGVMPYSFTFYVKDKYLIFEDSEVVEYDKPYSTDEFLSKDLSSVEGACVLVMFDSDDESEECFCHPDLMVGKILRDHNSDYFIRCFGSSYDYDIAEDENHVGCKVMLPSRSNLFNVPEEE
jgi:hypothetical protein|nr:MAG TPA: hypothetical protein [Caudoviricetes sp.]